VGLLAAAAGLLSSCKSPEPAPPPPVASSRLPNPPQVQDVTLGRPETFRVGDPVSVVLDVVDGQIPMSWRIDGLPQGWDRTTGTEGRFYRLSGELPLGSSAAGLDIVVQVTDSNGRRSEPLPVRLNIVPRTYEFQPTVLGESADGLTRDFELPLRAIPRSDPTLAGRIDIVIDTVGIPPAASGESTLRLWLDGDSALDLTQSVSAETSTASGIVEPGEMFTLASASHLAALAGGRLRLTIRCPNRDWRVSVVRVTLH
jgi:hypothetical protein